MLNKIKSSSQGKSKCTVTFGRQDLQAQRLKKGYCPIKNCDSYLTKAPYKYLRGGMSYLPFCPVHGVRIHKNTFVYFNGPSNESKNLSLRRNINFNPNFYINKVLKGGIKLEGGRLCYETSEDAVSWNVFTEIAKDKNALLDLVSFVTKKGYSGNVELYLWGGKIDFKRNIYSPYKPLLQVRRYLERDIKNFPTEPDIIFVIPGKLVICIEAKFGSKNPIADGKPRKKGEKPRSVSGLFKKYYLKNNYLKQDMIFDTKKIPKPFYEQLFRNIVFAASMAKIEGDADWFVANLRSQHVINLKRGKPESAPVTKNVRSMLMPKYKKQFIHITWEDIFKRAVKGNHNLVDLNWYLKNKSLNCHRAFNII